MTGVLFPYPTLDAAPALALPAVRLDGADVTRRRPYDLARAGIAHVPEGQGVITELTVEENLRLGALCARRMSERPSGRGWFTDNLRARTRVSMLWNENPSPTGDPDPTRVGLILVVLFAAAPMGYAWPSPTGGAALRADAGLIAGAMPPRASTLAN